MKDKELIQRYQDAKGKPELQQELATELNIKWNSVRDRVSAAKRKPTVYLPTVSKHRNMFIKDCGNMFELKTGKGFKTMIDCGDAQYPYEDPKMITLMVEFCRDFRPDYFNNQGDHADFYQCSKFSQDPSRLGDLQRDLNRAKNGTARFRDAMPNTKFLMTGGNHEDRLRRFLWNNAKSLSSLDCLDIEELLGLREMEIDYAPYKKTIVVNNLFKLEHGTIVRQFAGYTARAMSLKRGGNGVVGHTHRMGSSLKTMGGDTTGWWENGCLCDLNPEYTQEPDWQHGFSVITFIGDRFYMEQIPIIKYRFIYGGKLYE